MFDKLIETAQADLLASAANSFVSPRTEECVAVVGDCIANEVSLVSAKQVSFFLSRSVSSIGYL